MTTILQSVAPYQPGKGKVRPILVRVPLSKIDRPAERINASVAALPDRTVQPEALAAAMIMRPLVVASVPDTDRYILLGNFDVFEWLRHLTQLEGDVDRDVSAIVVPADGVDSTLLETVERHLLPMLLGQVGERAAMARIKAAACPDAVPHRATVNQRLKPVLRE